MIYTKLMKHQKYIVDRCKDLKFGAIFADYGTGKTLCALKLIDILPKMRKILVVSSKTAIMSTWPDEIRKHSNFKYVHLLGYPKKKIQMLQLGLRHSLYAETAYSAESYAPTIFLINFDGVRNISTILQQIGFDMIIVDECFVAGTKVSTIYGDKNIEDIRVGDKVYNALGISKVKRISSRQINKIIQIKLSNGRIFKCTLNHPIFTNAGWIEAKDLVYGDVVYEKENVQTLWKNSQEAGSMLQQILYDEIDKNWCKKKLRILWNIIKQKNGNIFQCKNVLLQLRSEIENREIWSMERRYTNEEEFKDKIIKIVKENWAQAENVGWKWERIAYTTKNVVESFRNWLGFGISNKNKSAWFEKISTILFKSRYSECKEKDSDRSRWWFSYWVNWTSSRKKKRETFKVVRVESVEILEQGSFNRCEEVHEKGTTVYNLEIESHPSFFVEGILVHNSTKIKSTRAIRTTVLWSLSRHCRRRFIMTGFPITEHLGEVYAQIKFLDMGVTLGNSYYCFLDKYFYKAGYKRVLRKNSAKKIFKLIEPFAIRVTNEVLDLPPKLYERKIITPTKQQMELFRNLKEYFQLELGKVKIDTEYIFALINKSLQICDGFVQDDKGHLEIIATEKDQAIIDLVDDIDPYKNKILIWAVFRFTVKKLRKIFKKIYGDDLKVLTLTGATEDVNKVVKQFQFKKHANILIATQKKAAESITLTNCKYAIYYSNSWSNDLRQNSEARIRRKGSEKHKSIIYTDLMLKNSIEELVYDCLRKKGTLIQDLKKNFKPIRMR